ncbi:MAG TPA: alcohol dehydrogenase catalytic domain-containing protein, partial [Pseudomonadota bacterium]|nr:alcohol dehydrogenase catalytic domain-containing protein [Pseudomonadota bacterium]
MSALAAPVEIAGTHSRQAMLVEPGRLELRDYVAPHPGPGELLIQIRCALSCGTDLKTFRRGHPLWRLPLAFGHEFSGVVAQAGEGVTAFKAGDEIMAAPTAPCGICFYCQHGQENLCDDAVGRMVHGAYADLLLLPAHVVARSTFIKPADLPFEEAALLEPLACVVHANEMARPEKNESVAIIGGGAFGLLHMLVLKAAGVREVVVVGRGAQRLQWAEEMGADRVVDARGADAAAEIARLNGGFGPDLVIECTGQVAGWQDALARVRRGGR